MSKNNDIPMYIATDEFLAEIRELGYDDFIELDDLIDFLDEDPAYILEFRPTILMIDEMNYVSPAVTKWMYSIVTDRRPT
jgi:hypothetical protein